MTLRAAIIDSAHGLAKWSEPWDHLAVTIGRPFSAPGWLLPWWEHMRPPGTRLHAILLVDGSELVGIAPFFVQTSRAGRRDLRLLGPGPSHGLDVLAFRGQTDAARVLARALADAHPTLVSFENIDSCASWPEAVRGAWPGRVRPRLALTGLLPAPAVTLDGDYERWLRSRSRNFRGQLGQARRRLEELGGRALLAATDDERAAAIAAFTRLHAARWEGRGGSNLSPSESSGLLADAARRLGPDRLRLWTSIVGTEVVAVQILVAAGGEVAYWNGGWDERYARARPGFLTLVEAIEDAFRRGDRRVDLCGGADAYKLRLADDRRDSAVSTRVLVPFGSRYLQGRAVLLPKQLRRATVRALGRLPEPHERRARALLRQARDVVRGPTH